MKKKRKRIISWAVIATIILFVIIVVIVCFCYFYPSNNLEQSWQLAYYLFSIIGAIGTLLAVIVALAKEEFLNWLNRPKLQCELVDDGISEDLEEQYPHLAKSFRGFVELKNTGNMTASCCKAYICSIGYSPNNIEFRNVDFKRTDMNWEGFSSNSASEINMPVGISNKIELYHIDKAQNMGTPGSSDIQKTKIIFNGCEPLMKEQSEKGHWKVNYLVYFNNGGTLDFAVTIDWDGCFKGRGVDMKTGSHLLIKIVEE